MRSLFPCLALLVLLVAVCCTKQVGPNPTLALSDTALLDSCKNAAPEYYRSDPNTILPGTNGPHGRYLLRFNRIAAAALVDEGRLPLSASMPEGSLVVKDVFSGTQLRYYAFMYKSQGTWLWGEIEPGGSVLHSVSANTGICTGCHGQSGNRDLLLTFKDY